MMHRTFICLICITSYAVGQYYITFDKDFSPPLHPPNPASMDYSVPLNHEFGKPVKAYFTFINGSIITDGPLANAIVKVESIDVKSASNPNYKDSWKESGGSLCQNPELLRQYKRRQQNVRSTLKCGSQIGKTILLADVFDGQIILDRLVHKHTIVPPNARILRIIHYFPRISEDSHPFYITLGADHIVITQMPPATIDANHPFQMAAEIRDEKGNVVTSGRDSVAFVDLTIPYYYKTFYNIPGKTMMLKHTSVRLAGDIIFHQSTNDLLIRQSASKGIATFKNIRILDSVKKLQLNITMSRSGYPWTRIPDCKVCYDDVNYMNYSSNKTEITFSNLGTTYYKKIKSLALTTPFDVLAQKLSYIKLSDDTLAKWKNWTDPTLNAIKINRNIQIPGGLRLFAYDKSAVRIFSGPDSHLKLKYSTTPPGVCISNDATSEIIGGSAYLFISVCQILNKLVITITVDGKSGVSVTTPPFNVDGHLNIAHIGDFSCNGKSVKLDSHINAFAEFAASSINKGHAAKLLAREGFKMKILSYNTGSRLDKALAAMNDIAQIIKKPQNLLQGLIGSVNDDVTISINSQLTALQMPYISTTNSGTTFSNKKNFPYFNRVCWSDTFIAKSIVNMVKERKWSMVIILREKKVSLTRYFRQAMRLENIDIDREIVFDYVTEKHKRSGEEIRFQTEMDQIRQWKCRILFLFANSHMQTYIFRAAYLSKIDTDNGYQWVVIGPHTWEFPFQNLGVCSKGPKTCTEAFRGTLFVAETYNITADSSEWTNVLGDYFSSDKYLIKTGVVRYRSLAVFARMALGYDATLLFSYALLKLIKSRKSFTGISVNRNIRNILLRGLTGDIKISRQGDRLGYVGFLGQSNAVSHKFHYLRILLMDNMNDQVEIPYTLSDYVILPIFKKYNKRRYLSRSGRMSSTTQVLINEPNEAWPSKFVHRYELVLPAFACEVECGFNQIDESDVNKYDTGICRNDGLCKCYPGYSGHDCKTIVCISCKNGVCISPDVCQCNPGWKGIFCEEAICDSCINGFCERPGKCSCHLNSVGYNCSIHVAAVVVPLIVGILLISFLSYFCVKKFLKHARLKSALSNLNWMVDWNDVECCQPEISFISRTSVTRHSLTFLPSQMLETYLWKGKKLYAKFIPNKTISLDDVDLRLQMVHLTQIKHINLIVFVGACIEAPYVCLFLDVAHKGSLNDVLHLASFDLGWEFRYSFMKDICSGMRYLHEETKISSHGRLKSHNCLIDSHWTVKISGFGAPSIRYGKYRLPRKEHSEDLKGLLWTAPELLEDAVCLDDIKSGTKSGDVYSFAIIISEILSWGDPYEYELDYISEGALLDLIRDPFNKENESTRFKWKEIGGTNMLAIRPILRENDLAQTVLRRKMTRHILAEAWDQVPSARPSFKKLLLMLEECYPASGGLIDNLINLLSAYSNNLEMIVMERTKEIEESKEKSEHLLSQLLPLNIAEQLKKGEKVTPELYECVTVYFSDIVDFGEILMNSTPFQIVDFLNEMYNSFDAVVQRYKVYKVETICETYIVVSGLPERIGPKHADEIATMSLDLMSLVTTFRIQHLPKNTLQLRIGIHSGPVVAGIVGSLMPRYCLFGDSVNTASRMESSSISLHIHVSETTAGILKDLGGYQLKSRGTRQVKGRGLMETYWLEGKKGFFKTLPDKSLAISLSRHKFK